MNPWVKRESHTKLMLRNIGMDRLYQRSSSKLGEREKDLNGASMSIGGGRDRGAKTSHQGGRRMRQGKERHPKSLFPRKEKDSDVEDTVRRVRLKNSRPISRGVRHKWGRTR